MTDAAEEGLDYASIFRNRLGAARLVEGFGAPGQAAAAGSANASRRRRPRRSGAGVRRLGCRSTFGQRSRRGR